MQIAKKKSVEADGSILLTQEDAPSSQRTIQSVERALSLLELLAAADAGVRLNDISKTLGLNASTCHHLLSTLMGRGYVAQSSRGRTYLLGNKVLELSHSLVRKFDLAGIAMESMRALNAETGETVHLVGLQGREVVTIAVLDSSFPVRVVSGHGDKSDAIHATATGKAILAWLPEAEMDQIIGQIKLTRFTEKTITSRDALIEELRCVRRNGFAVDNEEFQPGVVCIGAPIRDRMGAVVGSFSCSMPTMRAHGEHLLNVQNQIKAMARTLCTSLGGKCGE